MDNFHNPAAAGFRPQVEDPYSLFVGPGAGNDYSSPTYAVKYLGIVDGTMGVLSRKMAMPNLQRESTRSSSVLRIPALNMDSSRRTISQVSKPIRMYDRLTPLLGNKYEQAKLSPKERRKLQRQLRKSKLATKSNRDLQPQAPPIQIPLRNDTLKKGEGGSTVKERLQSHHRSQFSNEANLLLPPVPKLETINYGGMQITQPSDQGHISMGQQADFSPIDQPNPAKSSMGTTGLQSMHSVATPTQQAPPTNFSQAAGSTGIYQIIVPQQIDQIPPSEEKPLHQQTIEPSAFTPHSQGPQMHFYEAPSIVTDYAPNNFQHDPSSALNTQKYDSILQQLSEEQASGYPQPKLYDQFYINKFAYPKALKSQVKPDHLRRQQRIKRSLYDLQEPANREGFSGWKLTVQKNTTRSQSRLKKLPKYPFVVLPQNENYSGVPSNGLSSQAVTDRMQRRVRSLKALKEESSMSRSTSKHNMVQQTTLDQVLQQEQNSLPMIQAYPQFEGSTSPTKESNLVQIGLGQTPQKFHIIPTIISAHPRVQSTKNMMGEKITNIELTTTPDDGTQDVNIKTASNNREDIPLDHKDAFSLNPNGSFQQTVPMIQSQANNTGQFGSAALTIEKEGSGVIQVTDPSPINQPLSSTIPKDNTGLIAAIFPSQ